MKRTLGLILVMTINMSLAFGDILVLPYEGRFIEAELYDEPALFGNGLPYEGLHGMVINAEPPNACVPLQPAPQFEDNRTGRWILLVARFNCSFEDKVRNAQTARYDAVIVHNVGSDSLERMSANNASGIHIPSVFIGQSDGLLMRDVYANNTDYFVIINAETRVNWNKLLIPFLIVVGICFLVMIVFMVIKFMRDRRRQRRERLSSSALNRIPTHKFQKGDPYETCAICLDDYVDGEKLRVLPCAHAYHSKCIDPWLTKNRRVCPVCKRRVFAANETPYSDSDEETESDDTTPLLAGGAPRGTQGGTFDETQRRRREVQVRGIFARLRARSAGGNLGTGQHSINTEYDDARSEVSTTSTSTSSVSNLIPDVDFEPTVPQPPPPDSNDDDHHHHDDHHDNHHDDHHDDNHHHDDHHDTSHHDDHDFGGYDHHDHGGHDYDV